MAMGNSKNPALTFLKTTTANKLLAGNPSTLGISKNKAPAKQTIFNKLVMAIVTNEGDGYYTAKRHILDDRDGDTANHLYVTSNSSVTGSVDIGAITYTIREINAYPYLTENSIVHVFANGSLSDASTVLEFSVGFPRSRPYAKIKSVTNDTTVVADIKDTQDTTVYEADINITVRNFNAYYLRANDRLYVDYISNDGEYGQLPTHTYEITTPPRHSSFVKITGVTSPSVATGNEVTDLGGLTVVRSGVGVVITQAAAGTVVVDDIYPCHLIMQSGVLKAQIAPLLLV